MSRVVKLTWHHGPRVVYGTVVFGLSLLIVMATWSVFSWLLKNIGSIAPPFIFVTVIMIVWKMARHVSRDDGHRAPRLRSPRDVAVADMTPPAATAYEQTVAVDAWHDRRERSSAGTRPVLTLTSRGRSASRANADVDVKPHAVSHRAGIVAKQWIGTLRDPNAPIAVGMWRGGQYDLLASQYGGSLETAVNMHCDDMCAVSHLLNLWNPNGWTERGHRHRPGHQDWDEVCEAYGKKFLRGVSQMNDRGTRPKTMANYVERHLRREGIIS